MSGSLEVAQIYLSRWLGRWLGGWLGLTVIIELVSVQLVMNLPTGTGHGNTKLPTYKLSPVELEYDIVSRREKAGIKAWAY